MVYCPPYVHATTNTFRKEVGAIVWDFALWLCGVIGIPTVLLVVMVVQHCRRFRPRPITDEEFAELVESLRAYAASIGYE